MKIIRFIFPAALAIVAILAACPAADSGGDLVPGPRFEGLGINVTQKKIFVFFDVDIPGKPDTSKISVKKDSATLKLNTDYTLATEKRRLVITLLGDPPATGDKYTVELQAGAVRGANGKANTSSKNKTLTVGIIPAITEDPLAFKANSNTVLTLAFNTNIEIVDKAKIKVEVQADGAREFIAARATSVVDTTTANQLNLTLGNAATNGNVYRVTVGAGALRSKKSNLVNITELTSRTTYSASPILRTAPYILDNKLVAPFNLSIELNNWEKVKVYKDPAGENQEINLKEADIAVNSISKNLLEITLPAVTAGEVYRLRLAAGAVNKEGETANGNEAFTPADITIGEALALDTVIRPFFSRGRKIIVTFDSPIRILDKTKIKYRFKANTGAVFGAEIEPNLNPIPNNKQLTITLNDPPQDGQVYRIYLAAGALNEYKNKPSIGNIQSGDINAIGPTLENVTPVFTSKTEFSITFPVDVDIVGNRSDIINVQKKNDGDSFTTLTSDQRFINVDRTNPKKINITLVNGEEAATYTQVWKVVFPQGTMQTAKIGIINSAELNTNEVRPILTDLYGWERVRAISDKKWSERSRHTSVVFKNKIWVLGGYDGTDYLNDVWSSEDGATWTESTPSGRKTTSGNSKNWWSERYYHTSVVLNRKIWVLGGYDGTDYLNDVWSSEDGATWTESTPSGRKTTSGNSKNWWSERSRHNSMVFKGKIWVLGGNDGTDYLNDIWSSTDGSSWAEESAGSNPGWSGFKNYGNAVFSNKIWLAGGLGPDDINNSVWSSDNGQSWKRESPELSKPLPRPRMVEYDTRFWVIGGVKAGQSFWSSADPATGWTEEKTLPLIVGSEFQAVVFKDRIWLLGGKYGVKRTNNVWRIGPGPS